jgi:hypothetical protein
MKLFQFHVTCVSAVGVKDGFYFGFYNSQGNSFTKRCIDSHLVFFVDLCAMIALTWVKPKTQRVQNKVKFDQHFPMNIIGGRRLVCLGRPQGLQPCTQDLSSMRRVLGRPEFCQSSGVCWSATVAVLSPSSGPLAEKLEWQEMWQIRRISVGYK